MNFVLDFIIYSKILKIRDYFLIFASKKNYQLQIEVSLCFLESALYQTYYIGSKNLRAPPKTFFHI